MSAEITNLVIITGASIIAATTVILLNTLDRMQERREQTMLMQTELTSQRIKEEVRDGKTKES